jgi:hypothetical protein
MNYSNIDLNIDNYDNEDLEAFLNLGKNYVENDIVSKEASIRDKILNTITDKSFKNQIIVFLDEVKRLLIKKTKHKPLYPGDGTNFVIDKSQESIMNFVEPMNTFVTDTTPGVLNKLRRRTRIMTLAMNTLFRDSNSVSSTDCFFTLSYTLKNVVGIRLLSIELPESIYLVSSLLMSNWLYIWVPSTDASGNIIIPDGCYDAITLKTTLETAINTTLGTTEFRVLIDPISKRTTIYHTLGYEFDLDLYNPSNNNIKFAQSLGWIMGFRNKTYGNLSSYTSEGLFSAIPLEYMLFVLNDYHFSNSSSLVAILNDSYIDKNILAKIPYSNTNFQILFDGSGDVLSPHRQYYGPIDIKKFGMQLMNKYGQVVDVNCMDFSFTLEVEMVYDI